MIKIENLETAGWDAAIRGMRNPKNSWDRSDSVINDKFYNTQYITDVSIGVNDKDLMSRLNKGGPVHAKYRRMIKVYCDITAPLYWWKEFDTYKVGTVANSCSTMHKLGEKEFELRDFSYEKLDCLKTISPDGEISMPWKSVFKDGTVDTSDLQVVDYNEMLWTPTGILEMTIEMLNKLRKLWLAGGKQDKSLWYQMIQLLPSSYNQRRTVELNYEVLTGIYKWRKDHKLDEWREFCRFMKDELPESWIFMEE